MSKPNPIKFRRTKTRERLWRLKKYKDLSWLIVKSALRSGILTKSDICSKCANKGPTDAHHYLGYDPELWLDVEWLCKVCHAKQRAGTGTIKLKNFSFDIPWKEEKDS